MALVLTGNETLRFHRLATLYALKLECLGMKHSQGSVYAKIKRDYSLKGNKQSVYDQLKSILG